VRVFELEKALGEENTRPFQVFRTSIVDGVGYGDALKWLANIL